MRMLSPTAREATTQPSKVSSSVRSGARWIGEVDLDDGGHRVPPHAVRHHFGGDPFPDARVDQTLLGQHVGCRSDHERLITDQEQALGSHIAQIDGSQQASVTNNIDNEQLALRDRNEDATVGLDEIGLVDADLLKIGRRILLSGSAPEPAVDSAARHRCRGQRT